MSSILLPEKMVQHTLRHNFPSFLARSFRELHPAGRFLHNWHLDVLAHALQKLQTSDGKRLIVNVPPRSLKSVMISVAWPAFLLGHNPSLKILCASYSQSLSVKHSLDTRHLMQSSWYRGLFPQTELMQDQNEKHRFATTRHGMRLATSIGGTVTGEGGDILILDDPLGAQDAWNAASRTQANQWFDHVFSTRLNDKKKGIILLVMQRLHAEDLTGHLMQKGGFECLRFPVIATHKERWPLRDGSVYVRSPNALLHPARESGQELEQARQQLGAAAFAAQYQQAPIAQSGAMIKLDWFRRYKEIPHAARILQSWDTGIKAGSMNDPSACLTFALLHGEIYLLEAKTCRAEYPELRRLILAQAERFTPEVILIEDKASGQSLLQDLRRDTHLPLVPVMPKGDKLVRMARSSVLLEAGRVWLPDYANWLPAFEEEIASFPNAKHDDQADALSQALQYFRDHDGKGPQIRRF